MSEREVSYEKRNNMQRKTVKNSRTISIDVVKDPGHAFIICSRIQQKISSKCLKFATDKDDHCQGNLPIVELQ